MGVVLVGLSRGACLANSTLVGLGLTPVTPYTPSTNNTYCTGALQNAQSCADLTQIVTVTNTQKTAMLNWETANFTAALSNVTNAINDFNNLCNNTINNANVGRKLNNVTITQTMVTNCSNLSSISSALINNTANVSAQISGCTNMVATTINGAYCLFISSIATNYTTVSGNTITVTTTTDVPGLVVSQCVVPLYSVCYLNSLAAFLDQFTGNTTANATITNACGSITTMYNCTTNTNACSSSANALFTQFFTPTASLMGASLSRTFGASIISVRGYAVTTRRLLMSQSANMTTSYQVSSSGFNVATTATGLNGTNGTGTKGAAIYGLGFLFMLLALAFN